MVDEIAPGLSFAICAWPAAGAAAASTMARSSLFASPHLTTNRRAVL
jgi:hypothetical protein